MCRSYFDIREKGHGKCTSCEKRQNYVWSHFLYSDMQVQICPAQCGCPDTAVHNGWMDVGFWGKLWWWWQWC